MECKKVQKLLPWYLEGKLREGKRAEIKAHLINCPECRQNEGKLKVSLTLVGSLEGEKKKKQKRFKWDIYPENFSRPVLLSLRKSLRNGAIMVAFGFFLVWAANRLFYQSTRQGDISSIKGAESSAISLNSLSENQEKMLANLPRLVIKKAPGRLGPPGQPKELVAFKSGIKEIPSSSVAKAGKGLQSAIGAASSPTGKAERKVSIRPEKGRIESDIIRGKLRDNSQADIPIESVFREKPDASPAGISPKIKIEPAEELIEKKVKIEPAASLEKPKAGIAPVTEEIKIEPEEPGGKEASAEGYNRGNLYKKASQKLEEKLHIREEEK